MVESETSGGVGEEVGSAGVGCGGGSGGFDERDAGCSVADVVGGEEIDVSVAHGLQAAVGSALDISRLARCGRGGGLGDGASATAEE